MAAWPNDKGFDTDFEQRSPVQLKVQGNIPRYTTGVLYRTGPLGFKVKTNKGKTWAANHWFDGLSAVHRFEIINADDGSLQVHYRSRRIVDELMETVKKTGSLDMVTFGKKRDPCKSMFGKIFTMFTPNNRAPNVGVTLSVNMPTPQTSNHSGSIQTLHTKTDATWLQKINPETLEPEGVTDQTTLHPQLKGPLSASHAKSDPETGDIFNYNLYMGPTSTYRVFQTSASTGKTTILATFPGTPAYIHSLWLSKNYVILCVWNTHFAMSGLPVLYHKNMLSAMEPFDSSKKAKWYVVDRHGKGLVATYESDPFVSFHTINAWEETSVTDPTKTDILAEVCAYGNNDVLHRFYLDNLMSSGNSQDAEKRKESLPSFIRYRFGEIEAGKSTSKPRAAKQVYKSDPFISGELPVINPGYLTKPHRYTYAVSDRLKSNFVDGIVKFDSVTQESLFWETEAHTPGEPIFVADPNGVNEDDGVLLIVVLDGNKGESYLLVLNARDLKELGRAEVGGPVSFGFHGAYVGKNGGAWASI